MTVIFGWNKRGEMTMMWDRETDVVVVGYGLAGAVTATESHDLGAEVLILEKGRYPGGCSILAGGAALCASDVDEVTKYLRQISADRVHVNLIRPFAQGLAGNEQYLRKLARANGGKVQVMKGDGARDRSYPFEGRQSLYTVRVQEIPGFSGDFPWLQRLQAGGVNLMKTAMDNVEQRGIEVLFSTPAERLVTDARGIVTGLVARSASNELAIRARKAVVLACGGFEQNQWLQMQYLQGKPFYSMAPLTHTGDGILMAQKVGAALWHMWHVHGSYGFKLPDFPMAFRHAFSGPRNQRQIMPWIVVDKFGRRYMNEYPPAPQDTGHRAMEIFDPDMSGYPRIPSYLMFDEAGRKRGPIAKPLAVGERVYEWSEDNLEEAAKGWIISANSIAELGLKIREMDNNEGKMEPAELEATVSTWNDIVKLGKDPFHRPPGTMMPIEVAPFYTVPVWPIITNTQGGPVHNEKQQVIDAFGEPIPHLYCAGELGSFWSHLYQLAGNLGECLLSGRIAAKHASAEVTPIP